MGERSRKTGHHTTKRSMVKEDRLGRHREDLQGVRQWIGSNRTKAGKTKEIQTNNSKGVGKNEKNRQFCSDLKTKKKVPKGETEGNAQKARVRPGKQWTPELHESGRKKPRKKNIRRGHRVRTTSIIGKASRTRLKHARGSWGPEKKNARGKGKGTSDSEVPLGENRGASCQRNSV